jgi:hypothetical protein
MWVGLKVFKTYEQSLYVSIVFDTIGTGECSGSTPERSRREFTARELCFPIIATRPTFFTTLHTRLLSLIHLIHLSDSLADGCTHKHGLPDRRGGV